MGVKIDLLGKKFNRLTVIEDVGLDRDKKVLWKCVCDCGGIMVANSYRITSGAVKSCGCYKRDRNVAYFTKHGHSSLGNHTAEFTAWQNMKRRCYDTKNSHYKYYGGRNITVCDRWINSFDNFLADMGNKPTPAHSLDRFPDINGNYSPDNCR